MMRLLSSVRVAVLAVAIAAGCSSSEPTGPKQDLSDQQKQQVKELQEQRNKEWGGTK